MDRPLQDVFKVHCFGCGALNAHGLQIKSRWEGDDMLRNWKPEPYHIGHPGYVYGGTIARVLEQGERKTIIGCRVLHSGIECATAETVAVRVRLGA
jgi:hypothetical protein